MWNEIRDVDLCMAQKGDAAGPTIGSYPLPRGDALRPLRLAGRPRPQLRTSNVAIPGEYCGPKDRVKIIMSRKFMPFGLF